MGVADLIPGISSGTVAYSLSVYKSWISALDSISVSRLLRMQFRAFIQQLDLKVLLPILFGVVTSILMFASIISIALRNALAKDIFFVIATFLLMLSCIFFSREVRITTYKDLGYITLGFFVAGLISSMPALHFNPNLFFVFIGAAIASFAMMLPGISGSSILLLLNQYELVLSQLREFISSIIKFQFFNSSTAFICVFLSGVLLGIAVFSKLLKSLLENYPHKSNLLLFGLMLGCIFWFVTLIAKFITAFAMIYLIYKRKTPLVKI